MLVDFRAKPFVALAGLVIALCACAGNAEPATPTSPATAIPTAGAGAAVQPSPVIPSVGVEPGACASCLVAHQLQEGVTVRFILFHTADDAGQQAGIDDVLEPLRRRYGDMIQMKSFVAGTPEGREWLARVEDHFQTSIPPGDLPAIVIGERVLAGETMIRQQLTGIVEVGLNRGGIDWPALPGIETWSSSD